MRPPIPLSELINHLRHSPMAEVRLQMRAWWRHPESPDPEVFFEALATLPLRRAVLLEEVWRLLKQDEKRALGPRLGALPEERQHIWWGWPQRKDDLRAMGRHTLNLADPDAAVRNLNLVWAHPQAPHSDLQKDLLPTIAIRNQAHLILQIHPETAAGLVLEDALTGALTSPVGPEGSDLARDTVIGVLLAHTEPSQRVRAVAEALMDEAPFTDLPAILADWEALHFQDLVDHLVRRYFQVIPGREYASGNYHAPSENALDLWLTWHERGVHRYFPEGLLAQLETQSEPDSWSVPHTLDHPTARAQHLVTALTQGRWDRALLLDRPGLPLTIEVDLSRWDVATTWEHLDQVAAQPELSDDLKARVWAAIPELQRARLPQTLAHRRLHALGQGLGGAVPRRQRPRA